MLPRAISTSLGRRLRPPAAILCTAATLTGLSLLPAATAQAGSPAVTLPPAGEVEAVLGQTPLGSLTSGKLAETLSHVEGLEGLEPAALQAAIEAVIAELKGRGATLEELLKSVGSSTPAGEVIGKLLESSPEPQAVLAQILEALGPERLQSLLGSVLSGEPFSSGTVEELAGKLGTTVAALGAEFGKTTEQLPATAMAVTAPLKNGDTLAAVKAAEGMTLGVISSTGKTVGGTGAPGAPGTNGTSSTTPAPAATAKSRKTIKLRPGKVRLLSHRIKGGTATIVLQVPSAGTLSVHGKGLRQINRQTSRAERVTLHPSLTKARAAALHKHNHRYRVPLRITFKPIGGAASTVSIPLTYT